MGKLLSANLLRLRKSGLFWTALAVNAAFGAFIAYTHLSDRSKFGIEFILDEVFFGYAMIIGLIMAVFASMFLGTEFSDGTIRNKLTVGASRRGVYLANLAVVTLAGILSCVPFMVTATLFSAPVVGFFTSDLKLILTALLGSLVLCAAYCAIYTFISMLSSRKAVTAIVCILFFFALMAAIAYVSGRLDAPPETMSLTMVDGEMVSSMTPNPKYIEGAERAFYEFLADVLPTGQAISYFTLSLVHPLRMILASLAITAVTTLGGIFLFNRKDLK